MRLYRNRQGLTKGKNNKAKRPTNAQKKAASNRTKQAVATKEQTKANAKTKIGTGATHPIKHGPN